MRRVLLLSGLLLICASPLRAADGDVAHREQLRERYQQILMRRPQRAAAFEWLYQNFSDNEGLDAWIAQLQTAQVDNSAAPLILGYIAERSGRDDDALAHYDKASSLNPNDSQPHAARGMLLYRLKRHERAAKALRIAIACHPPRDEDVALYRALGRTHLSAGRDKEALATWLQLAEQYHDDPAVIEEVADLLLQQRQFDAATNQYQKLTAMDDDAYRTVRAQIAIASIDLQRDRTDEAIQRLTPTLESLSPDSWLRTVVRQRIEAAFLNVGRTDQLVGFYKDWATRRPGDLDIAKALSQLHLRLNDAEEAERVMRDVIQRAPSDADAHRNLADLLMQQGRSDEAAATQQTACDLEPTNADGWRKLGQIYLLNNTLEDDDRRNHAASAWLRISEGRPDDPTRALMAAEQFRVAGMTKPAIDHYRKLINLDPHNTASYEHLGQYLHELGRDDEAVAVLLRMADGDNDVPGNHARLAQLLDEFDYDEDALKAIQSALERVGKGAEAFDLTMRRYRIYIEREAYGQAEQSLADSDRLAQTPVEHRDTLTARVNLYQKQNTLTTHIKVASDPLLRAMLLRAANESDEAADVITASIDAEAESTWRVALAAEVLAGANRPAKAVEVLRTLVRREPRHEAVYMRRIAELSRAQRDWNAAVAAAQRMIALIPDQQEGYLLAADVFDEQENTEKAIDVLREGVRRNPRDATLLAALAQRLSTAGESSAAIDRYWRAYDASTDEAMRLRFAADLARVHIDSNRFDMLVEKWTRRSRDAVQQTDATLALAAAYRQAGMLGQAEQTLLDAVRLRPTDSDITRQLVELTSDRGAIDEAITHAQRLVTMPGSGAAAKRKLASLLNDAGRTDEAINLWRSLAGDVDQMGAEAAIELADTFARHGLDEESHRMLLDAARRWPDDWQLRYRAAVVFAQDGDNDRADAMFDALLTMKSPAIVSITPPAPPIWAMNSHAVANQSAVVNFWMYLPQLQSQIASQLPTPTSPFGRQQAGFTTRGSRSVLNDFRSTRTAALMYRLHAAQRNGTLKFYMHQLAARAGYTLTAKALAVKSPPHPNDPDVTARYVLLQALLLLDLNDEAFAALQQFVAEHPNDLQFAVLDAVFRVSPASSRSSILARPSTLSDDIDADNAALRRLASLDQNGAAQLRMMYAQRLMQRKDDSVAAKWIAQTLAEETDLQRRSFLATALISTGDAEAAADAVEAMLPQLLAAVEAQPSSQQHLSIIASLSQAIAPLYAHEQSGRALRLTLQLLDIVEEVKIVQPHSTRLRVQLNGQSPPSFTQVTFMVSPSLHYILQRWRLAMTETADLDAATKALATQYENGKTNVGRELAVLLALADRHADARQIVIELTKHDSNDEALQIDLARLDAFVNNPRDAITRLGAIDKTSAFAGEARRLRLLIARQANMDDPAREAAREIAAGSIAPHEQAQLDQHLRALGIAVIPPSQQVNTSATRTRNNTAPNPSTRSTDQLTRLMQQGPHGREAVIRMARRVVKDKSRYANQATGDREVRAAVNALVQVNAIDDVLAELQTQLKESPDNTALLQRLWVYCTLSNKREVVHQLIESRLAARPDDVYSRYEYANSLSRSSQFPQAATQYEKVIQDAPQLIRDGYSLMRTFDKADRKDRLVELIETTEFNKQLTVVRNVDGSQWLTQVASQFEQKEPALALRVYLKHAAVSQQPHRMSSSRIEVLRLAAVTDNITVLVKHLSALAPDSVSNQQHGSVFHNTTRALVMARNTKPIMLTQPPRRSTAAQAIVHTLAKHGELGALVAITNANTSNNGWYTNIGLPLAALCGIANQPQDLSAANKLANLIEKSGPASNQQTQPWLYEPLCLLMIDELGRNKKTLPLAVRFAVAGLYHTQPNQAQLHAQLTFHMTLARAAIAEGHREKAEEHYRKLAVAEPAQRAQLVASGASHIASYDMNTFTQKQAFVAAMAEDGFFDIAVEMLLGYEASFATAGNTHYMMQYGRLLASCLSSEPMRKVLPDRLDAMRAELDKHPDNTALAASLLRLYHLVGRDDDAIAIAEQTKTPGLIKPADRMALAQRMSVSGKGDQARQLIVSLVADGEGHRLTNLGLISMLFTTPAHWDLLATASEQLKLDADVLAHGEWWLTNLVSALPRNAQATDAELKTAYDRLQLRFLRVADQMTAVRGRTADVDRRHLASLVDQIAHVEGHNAAYAYLRDAIVPTKDAMAVASLNRIFAIRSQLNGDMQSLATQLIDLADKTGQVDALSKAIEQAHDDNTVWRDTFVRMAALIAIQRNDTPAAAKWIALVADKPVIDTNSGYDNSYVAIAQRAAKHDQLRNESIKLYEASWAAALMSPRQSGQAMQLLAPLVTAYIANKKHDALQGLLAQVVRKLDAQHGPDHAQNQIMGLCRFAGSMYADAGNHARALDYYRVLLRHPYTSHLHVPGDTTHSGTDDVVVQLLEIMHKENRLDAYLAHLPQDQPAPGDPPRNIESEVFRVTAHLVAGNLDEAVKAAAHIRDIDYPAGAQVWSRAAEKQQNKAAAALVRKLSEPLLIRWPSVFNANLYNLLNIYHHEHRHPPVEELEATIRSMAAYKDAPQIAPVSPTAFDGSPNYPGIMPPHAWLYRSTQNVLRQYLRHPLIARRDEAKLPLIGWMYHYMDADTNVIEWLDTMRTTQPNEAYKVVSTLFTSEQGAKWPMSRLFANGSGYTSGIVPLPRRDAQVIIEAAQDAGKLAEFAALCRSGSLSIESKVAARLALLADGAAGSDRFTDMWTKCVAGDEPFKLDDKNYIPFKLYDPALITLINLTPPKTAANLIADAISARRRREFAHPNYAHDNFSLAVKRIELLAIADQRDDAVAAVNDLVKQHASMSNTNQISRDAQYIEQIAQKYDLHDAAYAALSTASDNNDRLTKAYRHQLARLQREINRAKKDKGEPSP